MYLSDHVNYVESKSDSMTIGMDILFHVLFVLNSGIRIHAEKGAEFQLQYFDAGAKMASATA